MTGRLKQLHQHNYTAYDANWSQWANYILSSPAHNRYAFIAGAPPPDLIQIFNLLRENEGLRMQRIHQTQW